MRASVFERDAGSDVDRRGSPTPHRLTGGGDRRVDVGDRIANVERTAER
jgi:hypothetical protein